jgi:hypothetical protein
MYDLARPLSNDEWVELTDVLGVGDGPDIDYCVGLVTAIASAPSLVPPSEWLAVVLGRVRGGGDYGTDLRVARRCSDR